MRVLSFERDSGACNHYRVLQPLYKMLNNGLANILTINKSNCSDQDFVNQKILESQIILIHRPADEKWLNLIRAAKRAGKIVVADYDDDPFNTSPWNEAYRWYGVQEVTYKQDEDSEAIALWKDGEDGFSIEANIERRDLFKASFKSCDLVTCTTDNLKDTFSKINPNTVVLPNLIDCEIFQPIHMVKTKEIRIGYVFGNSHYEDFYMVRPHLKSILDKFPQVKLVFFGDCSFHGLFKDFPKDRIEWHSWVGVSAYPYKLMTLNIDIGICPLVDNAFNRCKSSLKWMEYSAIGVATVASNMAPYSVTISDGKDGILSKDDEWTEKLTKLIQDGVYRKQIAMNAYKNVQSNHNADKKAYLWEEAYQKVLSSDALESL